jgi:hypothetical protein
LIKAKSSFVASIKSENHCLVVYEDSSEKESLAVVFVEAALKRKDLTVLAVSDNDRIIRLVMRRRRKSVKKALAKRTILSVDSSQAYGKPPSRSSFENFFRRILQEGNERGLPVSYLAEFPTDYYHIFDVENEIERFVDSYMVSKRPTGLCMNKKSAVFSLEPRQLISLIEAHDRSLFATMPIRRSG